MKLLPRTGLFPALCLLLFSSASLVAEEARLGAGSDAPALKPAEIVKGRTVELGKGLHVVELWATWCGPCKESIPRLTALAKKFAEKVDFTGVSIMEQGDALARVKAFVRQMGDKMDYNVAYDGPDGVVEKDWYKAAGEAGIPTAFVVQDGKILWVGHPLSLEPVLADIIAGTFDPKKEDEREEQAAQEMSAHEKRVQAVRDASDANDGRAILAAVKEVLAADPAEAAEMMPYQFEGLAMTDLPGALAYLKQWSQGLGFEQEPINAYHVWLTVMRRSIKLSKEDWSFLAALLDRCNARVQPINPVTASAEATAYARSGDPAKAAEWEKKALELADGREDGDDEWLAKHQEKLAAYQRQAGLEVTPPGPGKHEPPPKLQAPEQKQAEAGADEKQRQEKVPGAKLIGQPAPAFALENLEGGKVSLADLKGSVVVLDFWATWCGPCVESLPGLDAIYRELSPRGLKVFALNEAETAEKIRPKAAKLKLSLPILRDADGKVSDAYLVDGIPHTVVIGPDGKVLAVFSGSGNEENIRAAVLKAMNLTEQFALASRLPLVDDDATGRQLAENFEKLRRTGRLVAGDTLAQQLRAASQQTVTIPAAKIVPALTPDRVPVAADLYERSRAGVLILAGGSKGGDRSGSDLFTASAFVVTASGVAVTNYHVVNEVEETDGLIAMTCDGRAVAVRSVLAADRLCDIAVIQLDGDGFTPLTLAEGAAVGAPVAVLSHPDNHFYTLTRGIVSRYCLKRYEEKDPYPTPVIEITADYARGSSGGPLLDAEGRVIGMVCSTQSVYLGQRQGISVGLQMVMKDSVPSELIIALLRGEPLKILADAVRGGGTSVSSK